MATKWTVSNQISITMQLKEMNLDSITFGECIHSASQDDLFRRVYEVPCSIASLERTILNRWLSLYHSTQHAGSYALKHDQGTDLELDFYRITWHAEIKCSNSWRINLLSLGSQGFWLRYTTWGISPCSHSCLHCDISCNCYTSHRCSLDLEEQNKPV